MDKNHSHIYPSLRRAAALLCAALLFAGCRGCPASKADSPAAGSGTASISASAQADGWALKASNAAPVIWRRRLLPVSSTGSAAGGMHTAIGPATSR